MTFLSVIIPARNEPYLQKTVDDVFAKADGAIEVIVVIDGGNDRLLKRSGLNVIYHDRPQGTRRSLNEAIKKASGEYVLKLDAHCMVSKGFDDILISEHNPEWIVTMPRYSLDPEKWQKKFPRPVCYEYIKWPLDKFDETGNIGGLTPKKIRGPGNQNLGFYWAEKKFADIIIDDIQTCNAACWFLTKEKYSKIGGLDERLWNFHIDGVEIGFKAWLSGGALKINKNCYHAHYFKSDKKRTVNLNRAAMRNTQHYSTWYWTHDQWLKATRKFEWFVEKFWPIPTWPDDWKEQFKKIPPIKLEQYQP
jgi:glycosyltransferase involved in cell wall biosynthesis